MWQHTLISPQPDQEGNKLQRQKILTFIYPIYNHNWKNTSTIYINNKTSIKRNILTIKQYTGKQVGLRTYQHRCITYSHPNLTHLTVRGSRLLRNRIVKHLRYYTMLYLGTPRSSASAPRRASNLVNIATHFTPRGQTERRRNEFTQDHVQLWIFVLGLWNTHILVPQCQADHYKHTYVTGM